MTKTPLKPSELGISLREYAALMGTRYLLKSGLLRHNADGAAITNDARVFDMNMWCDIQDLTGDDGERHCCTAQCIGGTMAWLLGSYEALDETRDRNSALNELFFPGTSYEYNSKVGNALANYGWHNITVEDAITAIDNYRYTGHAKWENVLDISQELHDLEEDIDAESF